MQCHRCHRDATDREIRFEGHVRQTWYRNVSSMWRQPYGLPARRVHAASYRQLPALQPGLVPNGFVSRRRGAQMASPAKVWASGNKRQGTVAIRKAVSLGRLHPQVWPWMLGCRHTGHSSGRKKEPVFIWSPFTSRSLPDTQWAGCIHQKP